MFGLYDAYVADKHDVILQRLQDIDFDGSLFFNKYNGDIAGVMVIPHEAFEVLKEHVEVSDDVTEFEEIVQRVPIAEYGEDKEYAQRFKKWYIETLHLYIDDEYHALVIPRETDGDDLLAEILEVMFESDMQSIPYMDPSHCGYIE